MLKNESIQVFDGDYEVIFSKVINVYEDKLILKSIEGFQFEFRFLNDKSVTGSKWEIKPSPESKEAIIEFTNFRNSLGIGTIKKIPIIKLDNNKEVFFSIHAKTLNENTTFMQVTVTFYLK